MSEISRLSIGHFLRGAVFTTFCHQKVAPKVSAGRKVAGNSQRLAKTGACRGFASKPAPFLALLVRRPPTAPASSRDFCYRVSLFFAAQREFRTAGFSAFRLQRIKSGCGAERPERACEKRSLSCPFSEAPQLLPRKRHADGFGYLLPPKGTYLPFEKRQIYA